MAIASLLVGAVSALAPKLLDHFKGRQDNKQELAMMALQLKSAEKTAAMQIDMTAIAGAEASYQASLRHDTSAGKFEGQTGFGRFLADLMGAWRSAIRPGIVSLFVLMYCAVKAWTCYELNAQGVEIMGIIEEIWTYQDWAMLELTVGYYFTNRGIEKYCGK